MKWMPGTLLTPSYGAKLATATHPYGTGCIWTTLAAGHIMERTYQPTCVILSPPCAGHVMVLHPDGIGWILVGTKQWTDGSHTYKL